MEKAPPNWLSSVPDNASQTQADRGDPWVPTITHIPTTSIPQAWAWGSDEQESRAFALPPQ